MRKKGSPPSRAESGVGLLAVLVLILVVAGSSASFVSFMNQQQARAWARLRTSHSAG